jgi:hypothetical protein
VSIELSDPVASGKSEGPVVGERIVATPAAAN